MKKLILEFVERLMAVILSVMSCVGMFFTGCLAGNLFLDELTTEIMWAIFLGCVILTYVFIQILLEARYQRLLIVVDEQAFKNDEEAQQLYGHLTQGL